MLRLCGTSAPLWPTFGRTKRLILVTVELEHVSELFIQLRVLLDHLADKIVLVTRPGRLNRELGERRLETVNAVAFETHAGARGRLMRGHVPMFMMIDCVVAVLISAGSHLLLPGVPVVALPRERCCLTVASEVTPFGPNRHVAALMHWLARGETSESWQS